MISEKEKQTQIDEIMDNFEFGKVCKMMRAVDWNHYSSDYDEIQEFDLRKMARKLLNNACDIFVKEFAQVSCGGFIATLEEDESGFVLTLKWGLEYSYTGDC